MDLGLSGKKAIITGSTRGIGRAIANLLADEGVDLAICSRHQAEVDSAISELSAKGVKVIGAAPLWVTPTCPTTRFTPVTGDWKAIGKPWPRPA